MPEVYSGTAVDSGKFVIVDVQSWANGTLGAMANYGTSPGAVLVPGVNSFVTNNVNVTLSAETTKVIGTINQGTSPWVVSLSSTTVTGTVTTAGNLTNNNAAPAGTNVGVLPGIANAAVQTWTEGDQVLESMDLKGNQRMALMNVAGTALGAIANYGTSPGAVKVEGVNAFVTNTVNISGGLTNNNATPVATNVGVLPGIANASAPTWGEGLQVLESMDLQGNQRVIVNGLPFSFTPVFVNSAVVNDNGVPTTSHVLTYTPTAGNAIVVSFLSDTAISAVTCKDNNNNLLTAHSSNPQGSAPGYQYTFYGLAVAGATSYTVGWTTSAANSSSILAEYTLVKGFGNVGSHTNVVGTTTSISVSTTATFSTSLIVGGFAAHVSPGANPNWATSTGTFRASASNTGNPVTSVAIADLKSTGYSASMTQTLTTTAAHLSGQAVELIGAFLSVNTTISGTTTVAGSLTNNNAAPTATLIGVLPAIAETAYTTVTYSTGDMVLPVTDLHGALNTDLQAIGGTAVSNTTAGVQDFNVKAINNVTPLMGNGTTGTGSQRVTIVSDNTPFQVKVLGNAGAIFDGATAASVPANALLQGNRGATANPTAVTDGQMVASMADKLGRQVVVLNQIRDLVVCTPTTIASTTTATSIMAAGGASVFMDITSLVITTSTSVNTTATLSDGTASYIYDIAATPGTGVALQFLTPLKATSSNTAWTLQLGVNTVTVHVTCIAVKNL